MSCFDEKENNDHFLLSILELVCSTSITVGFLWRFEGSFGEEFCGDSAIKILLPINLEHPQKFKGCDSSLKAEAVSGISCSSLLMVEWPLITMLVTCTLYQPMALHFFFFFFGWRGRKQKGKRKATEAEGKEN